MAATALQNKIAQFFRRYEQRFQRALDDPDDVDIDGITGAFAEYFVGSNPQGVRGGKNGLMYRLAMRRGFARYRKIGTVSMKVAALETTVLDKRHVMAKVTWDSRYRRRKDGAEVKIVFANVYLLRLQRGAPKIFAYVTGDEEALLKKHRLL